MRLMLIFITCFVIHADLTQAAASKNRSQRRAAKEVYWSAGAEPVSLDPTKQVDGSSASWLGHIYEGLLTYNQSGNIVPATAERWTVSDDKKRWTFYLRSSAKWQDGKPVRAQDFEFAFRRLVDPGYASIYAFIAETAGIRNAGKIIAKQLPKEALGVKSIDERTFEVELEHPVAFFAALMAFQSFFPIRADLVEKFGANFAIDPASVIGNGPFRLVQWRKDDSIRIEKADTYWNAASIKLNAIESPSLIKDAQADYNNFQTGGIDYLIARSPEVVHQAQAAGFKVQAYDSGCVFFLSLNSKAGRVFADRELRLAVQAGINRSEFVNKIVAVPGNKPIYPFVPSYMPGAKPGSGFRSELPVSWKDHDSQAAALHLANYLKNSGQSKVPSFTLLSGDSSQTKKFAEYWQNSLAKILKTDVRIETLPGKAAAQRQRDLQYDSSITGWCPDYLDAMTFMDFHTSTNDNNFTGWSNKRYDELIAQSFVEGDPLRRMRLFAEAEGIYLSEAPSVPFYQAGGTYFVTKGLRGIKRNAVGISIDFRAAYWE